MKPEILTHSGISFNLLNPEPDSIRINDIAWALSHLCRFTGHTKAFYSVAEHSVRTMWHVGPGFELEALLHDATEAYLGDVSSPLKHMLPTYKAIETTLAHHIRVRFGLPLEESPQVKAADLAMLAMERTALMPHHHEEWDLIKGVQPAPAVLVPMAPHVAYSVFLEAFVRLTGRETYQRLSQPDEGQA